MRIKFALSLTYEWDACTSPLSKYFVIHSEEVDKSKLLG